MGDTSVKIESDPYRQRTRVYVWDDKWIEVNESYDSGSGLINEELVKGFFPFKVKKILNLIIREFGSPEDEMTVVFEGSDDEYDELRAACNDPELSGIILVQSERTLPNARDVLPSIRERFNGIRPLIDEGILERDNAESDMEKFYDASADLIPICVLGNYSAGKSTFINALIGCELLPSGAQAVTAKVFQITRSRQRDRAYISFESGRRKIDLHFSDIGLIKNSQLDGETLYDNIVSELDSVEATGMVPCMNRVIQLLNGRNRSDEFSSISDLVKIEVPFSPIDAWTQDSNFVFFDTPGYNTVSNEDHVRVLKKAMEGFSNGLLLYVAELDDLDAQDNANLCKEIRNFEAIDERFAMIVINKADSADLPEEGFSKSDEREILDQFIPANLFAQGVYFVSSVVGLGSKIDGKFISRNCTRVFHQQKGAFSDPDDPFYTPLYRYNILPQQTKTRNVEDSERCQNVLLANSGLHCIEREMSLFAERYSAYNKCQQSLVLLKRLAESTKSVIDEARQRLEADKARRKASLSRDESELKDTLDEMSTKAGDCAVDEYPIYMSKRLESKQWFITQETLKEKENTYTETNQRQLSLSELEGARNDAIKAIGGNLGDRMRGAFESRNLDSLIAAVRSVSDDAKVASESWKELGDVRRDVDRYAAEALLADVRDHFERSRDIIEEEIVRSSKAYWLRASLEVKNALSELATGSSVLSESKRKELGELIIAHPDIEFPQDATEIFVKDQLGKGLELRNLLIVKSEKLSLQKLERVFNFEIDIAFEEMRKSIGTSHENAFRDWQTSLLDTIEQNLIEYNPDLRIQAELIREDERRIAELTTKLNTIESCVEHVERLIGWREY